MSMFNDYDDMLTIDEACEALKIGHRICKCFIIVLDKSSRVVV